MEKKTKESIKKWSIKGATYLITFIVGLLVSTQLHTANINLQHYFPGDHFFGEWSDFSIELNRIQNNYNDQYNFTFDIVLSNHWIETRTAHIKVTLDSSSNKVSCLNDGQLCDDIYVNLPPNVQEKEVITPSIIIEDFTSEDLATDGYKLCVDMIDNNDPDHNIQSCKTFYILDR